MRDDEVVVLVEVTQDNLPEGGFPGPVRTHEADVLVLQQPRGHLVQHLRVVTDVERFGHVVEPRLLGERQVGHVVGVPAQPLAERQEPTLDLFELVEQDTLLRRGRARLLLGAELLELVHDLGDGLATLRLGGPALAVGVVRHGCLPEILTARRVICYGVSVKKRHWGAELSVR